MRTEESAHSHPLDVGFAVPLEENLDLPLDVEQRAWVDGRHTTILLALPRRTGHRSVLRHGTSVAGTSGERNTCQS